MVWTPFWRLSWGAPHPAYTPPPPLPDGVSRAFIPTASGQLEILSALPDIPDHAKSPTATPHVVFLHGGFGSAAVWLEYLAHLSRRRGISCHALSTRGHGASWNPGFVRMVLGTRLQDFEQDVLAGLMWLAEQHGGDGQLEVVLAGHSSGGGLAQWVIDRGNYDKLYVKMRGLVLLAGTPCFGQIGVYWNWLKHDPLFPIRVLFHLYHPASPLSSLGLVKGAFFSSSVPLSAVQAFRNCCMSPFESYIWPNQMIRPFADARSILQHISGWGISGGQKVLVVAGRGDKLMGTDLMEQMTEVYRQEYVELLREKRIDGTAEENRVKELDKYGQSAGRGVRYVVLNAGHHMQNDDGWEQGAEQLAGFWAQL